MDLSQIFHRDVKELLTQLHFLRDEGSYDVYFKQFIRRVFPLERFLTQKNYKSILEELLILFVDGLQEETRLYVWDSAPSDLLNAMNMSCYYEDVVKHERINEDNDLEGGQEKTNQEEEISKTVEVPSYQFKTHVNRDWIGRRDARDRMPFCSCARENVDGCLSVLNIKRLVDGEIYVCIAQLFHVDTVVPWQSQNRSIQQQVLIEVSRLLLGMKCGYPLGRIQLPEIAVLLSAKRDFDVHAFCFDDEKELLWQLWLVRVGLIQNSIVFPTTAPFGDENKGIMEKVKPMIDAAGASGVNNLCLQEPWMTPFAFSTYEKRWYLYHESIVAKLVANLITEACANLDILVEHIYVQLVILDYKASKTICSYNLVILSLDIGGDARGHALAKKLSDAPLAIVDKRQNVAEVLNLIVNVRGKVAVMVNAMFNTAGTIAKHAELIHREGVREVYACSTHAVFSLLSIEKCILANCNVVLLELMMLQRPTPKPPWRNNKNVMAGPTL